MRRRGPHPPRPGRHLAVLAALAETVRALAQGDLEHLGRGHGADPGAVLAELAGISDVS